jgi:outer membrane receptor protein involved in Fe transport
VEDEVPGFSQVFTDSIVADGEAYSAELQYQHRMSHMNLIAGGGYFEEDETRTFSLFGAIIDPPPPIVLVDDTDEIDVDPEHTNAYLYSLIKPHRELTLTAGLSYDGFHSRLEDQERFNPKLGLMWESAYGTTVRAAWFKTIKRPFASNQTIEPTQVAGFNQFFDDFDGTRTTRYGAAVEQRFTSSLFAGAEASWRDLKRVVRVEGREDQDEQLHRAYLYWTPTKRLAFNAEYFLEDFDFEGDTRSLSDLRTHRVPLGMSLYWPSGLIAQLQTSYVRQGITDDDMSDHDQFWVLDASVGYRLPRRWGILRLTGKNILDKRFNYNDVNFNTSEPLIPLFQPERQVFARLTLAF